MFEGCIFNVITVTCRNLKFVLNHTKSIYALSLIINIMFPGFKFWFYEEQKDFADFHHKYQGICDF